jgi:phosphoglycolate phosphatase-like HAD superfamily hydrolase
MQSIKAVLIEPVGCLAEFSADEFNHAAALFGASEAIAGGSQAYWRLLGLMQQRAATADAVAAFELRAVERAELYEDVRASLAELGPLGVRVILASSLARAAVTRFVERNSLSDLFAASFTRDEARGVGAHVLRFAIAQTGLDQCTSVRTMP